MSDEWMPRQGEMVRSSLDGFIYQVKAVARDQLGYEVLLEDPGGIFPSGWVGSNNVTSTEQRR